MSYKFKESNLEKKENDCNDANLIIFKPNRFLVFSFEIRIFSKRNFVLNHWKVSIDSIIQVDHGSILQTWDKYAASKCGYF